MKKKIIIILIILIILFIISVLYFTANKKEALSPTTAPGSVSLPVAKFTVPSQTEEKMTIHLEKESFSVNNLYKNPVRRLEDDSVTFLENSDFTMLFYPKDQSFSIALLSSENLAVTREKAENAFLQKLEISKEQACKLTGFLGVPYSISPEISGINFGFSFCPSGKPFP